MATKTQKALVSAKAASARARSRAKEGRSKMTRKVSMAVAGYGLGALDSRGALDRFPTFFGLPKLVTIGAAASILGEYVSGTGGDFAEGVADTCIAVASYQLGSGQEVSGGISGADNVINEHESVVAGLPPRLPPPDIEGEFNAGYEDALAEMEAAGVFDEDEDPTIAGADDDVIYDD